MRDKVSCWRPECKDIFDSYAKAFIHATYHPSLLEDAEALALGFSEPEDACTAGICQGDTTNVLCLYAIEFESQLPGCFHLQSSLDNGRAAYDAHLQVEILLRGSLVSDASPTHSLPRRCSQHWPIPHHAALHVLKDCAGRLPSASAIALLGSKYFRIGRPRCRTFPRLFRATEILVAGIDASLVRNAIKPCYKD